MMQVDWHWTQQASAAAAADSDASPSSPGSPASPLPEPSSPGPFMGVDDDQEDLLLDLGVVGCRQPLNISLNGKPDLIHVQYQLPAPLELTSSLLLGKPALGSDALMYPTGPPALTPMDPPAAAATHKLDQLRFNPMLPALDHQHDHELMLHHHGHHADDDLAAVDMVGADSLFEELHSHHHSNHSSPYSSPYTTVSGSSEAEEDEDSAGSSSPEGDEDRPLRRLTGSGQSSAAAAAAAAGLPRFRRSFQQQQTHQQAQAGLVLAPPKVQQAHAQPPQQQQVKQEPTQKLTGRKRRATSKADSHHQQQQAIAAPAKPLPEPSAACNSGSSGSLGPEDANHHSSGNSSDPEDRLAERRRRNNQAASRYRRRRKEQQETLQSHMDGLQATVDSHRAELQRLQEERRRLREELLEVRGLAADAGLSLPASRCLDLLEPAPAAPQQKRARFANDGGHHASSSNAVRGQPPPGGSRGSSAAAATGASLLMFAVVSLLLLTPGGQLWTAGGSGSPSSGMQLESVYAMPSAADSSWLAWLGFGSSNAPAFHDSHSAWNSASAPPARQGGRALLSLPEDLAAEHELVLDHQQHPAHFDLSRFGFAAEEQEVEADAVVERLLRQELRKLDQEQLPEAEQQQDAVPSTEGLLRFSRSQVLGLLRRLARQLYQRATVRSLSALVAELSRLLPPPLRGASSSGSPALSAGVPTVAAAAGAPEAAQCAAVAAL